jgi:hypothetical protein
MVSLFEVEGHTGYREKFEYFLDKHNIRHLNLTPPFFLQKLKKAKLRICM